MPSNNSKDKSSKSKHDISISTDTNESYCEPKTETISLIKMLIEQVEKTYDVKISLRDTIVQKQIDALEAQMLQKDTIAKDRIDKLEHDMHELRDERDKANTRANNDQKRADVAEAKVVRLEANLETVHTNIDEVEMNSRRSYLVVNNLPGESDKTDEDVFIKMCDDHLRIKVTKDQLYSVTRARGKQSNVDPVRANKPRSMIIRFQNEKNRDTVFNNKRCLKGKGIVITEFLTAKRSQLLKECISRIQGDFSTRSIWTDNGKILVKIKNKDGITHIASSNDLEKFLVNNPQSSESAPV